MNYLSGTQAIARVRAGETTVEQIVKDHLARVSTRPDVKAWAFLDSHLVLAAARKLDAAGPLPLKGMIVGVKDVYDTSDMPTQHGSPIYAGNQPALDAGLVAVLRAAGALILGKTHTSPFAFGYQGPATTNPFDPKRTAGGSSSGSAAGVADWQCHVGVGTQTVGSTIGPASFNDIFGFKPTLGTITRSGMKMGSSTLDHPTFLSRSIPDLGLLLDALAFENLKGEVKPIKDCTFAFIKTDQWDAEEEVTPDVERAWNLAQSLLKKSGATVLHPDTPSFMNGIMPLLESVLKAEAHAAFLPDYIKAKELLSADIVDIVENSKPETHAHDALAQLRSKVDAWLGGYDAVVTLATPYVAPQDLPFTGTSRLCGMWTALHVPAVCVPGFAGEDGMPLGMQLVAPRRLLAVAGEVAKMWVGANADAMRKLPAPKGTQHCVV